MDLLDNLALGISVAFSFQNLTYALLGCMVGTLIGVLPGIGPVATIAMLLPITFHLPPTASLIMLAGIYYGAQYGGSTTSILVNLPGEASSVVLASGSVIKAIAMVFLGLLFGLVGTDVNTGAQRFTFDVPELSDGIDFAPIAMGLFGIAEIVVNLERHLARSGSIKVGSLWPTREEARRAWPAIVRGTALGSILGVLPGGGPTLGAF